jgi:hypothetical protein
MIASRALVTLLFGISRLDSTTYIGVIALLVGCVNDRQCSARVDRGTGEPVDCIEIRIEPHSE